MLSTEYICGNSNYTPAASRQQYFIFAVTLNCTLGTRYDTHTDSYTTRNAAGMWGMRVHDPGLEWFTYAYGLLR